jgi:hypothetical protein
VNGLVVAAQIVTQSVGLYKKEKSTDAITITNNQLLRIVVQKNKIHPPSKPYCCLPPSPTLNQSFARLQSGD